MYRGSAINRSLGNLPAIFHKLRLNNMNSSSARKVSQVLKKEKKQSIKNRMMLSLAKNLNNTKVPLKKLRLRRNEFTRKIKIGRRKL